MTMSQLLKNNSSIDYVAFVTSTNEFVEDENYLIELNDELESLNLFSPNQLGHQQCFLA